MINLLSLEKFKGNSFVAKYDFNTTIIGGGVIGLSIAYSLSKKIENILLLEENDRLGQEISARNSEVIHAGIYYKKKSLKTFHCLRGNRLLYNYCKERGIPFRRVGKLIVAKKDSSLKLKELFRNAKENGVNELRYLSKREILALEPELEVDEAIFSGTSGIIDSHGFIHSLADDFEINQGIIMQKTSFSAAKIGNEKINMEIINSDKSSFTFTTKTLINASGLSSSENSKKITGKNLPDIPETIPYKGNYFHYSGKNPFSHLIYPLPDQDGLGIHATIDMSGKLKFGPDVDLGDTSLKVNPKRKEFFLEQIRKYWPKISEEKLVPDYVGLRPKIFIKNKIHTDFFIQDHTVNETRLICLHGIESPGLTSSLSLAQDISSRIS